MFIFFAVGLGRLCMLVAFTILMPRWVYGVAALAAVFLGIFIFFFFFFFCLLLNRHRRIAVEALEPKL